MDIRIEQADGTRVADCVLDPDGHLVCYPKVPDVGPVEFGSLDDLWAELDRIAVTLIPVGPAGPLAPPSPSPEDDR